MGGGGTWTFGGGDMDLWGENIPWSPPLRYVNPWMQNTIGPLDLSIPPTCETGTLPVHSLSPSSPSPSPSPRNGPLGSVVCVYTLDDLEEVFNGNYLVESSPLHPQWRSKVTQKLESIPWSSSFRSDLQIAPSFRQCSHLCSAH